MNSKSQYWVSTSLMIAFLSACGGSGGGSNFIGVSAGSNKTGSISVGISDAPVDDVKEVVVEIDKITFKKAGKDDVVVDRFTSSDLNISDVDSFQIDLLEYRGSNQAIVINDITLPAGKYTDMVLSILDEDLNKSYVIENDDERKVIKVPSDTLKLGAFTVDADGEQTFTIEFNLRQAMTFTPGSSDTYNLKPRGIRLQDNNGDRTISGMVDSSLFDTEAPCDAKAEPTVGNVVYLYEGHNLNVNNLADVFDPSESGPAVPANAIEPFATTAVVANGTNQWRYSFAFLPAGDYTLAFSCDAANDDPEDYDGLTLPFPSSQLIELSTGSLSAVCDLPIDDDGCA